MKAAAPDPGDERTGVAVTPKRPVGPRDANLEPALESVRIDRYLWAIRICKTRTSATELCRAGHVRIGAASVRPAHLVRRGELVTINLNDQTRIIEPVELIANRVGAPGARECYLDRSPTLQTKNRNVAQFWREASSGRPTKRDRRMLDQLRERSR